MLGNTELCNHSRRTAQEMLELIWHPNFHHKNIVIAIFTRIFYTSYIQSGGRVSTLWNSMVPINLKLWIQLGKLCRSAIPLFLDEKLYISVHHCVQFKLTDYKDKQISCLELVIINLLARQSTGLWDTNSCLLRRKPSRWPPSFPLKHFEPRVDPFS